MNSEVCCESLRKKKKTMQDKNKHRFTLNSVLTILQQLKYTSGGLTPNINLRRPQEPRFSQFNLRPKPKTVLQHIQYKKDLSCVSTGVLTPSSLLETSSKWSPAGLSGGQRCQMRICAPAPGGSTQPPSAPTCTSTLLQANHSSLVQGCYGETNQSFKKYHFCKHTYNLTLPAH